MLQFEGTSGQQMKLFLKTFLAWRLRIAQFIAEHVAQILASRFHEFETAIPST